MDVNVRGEMVLWVVIRVNNVNRNRAFFWDGNVEHPPVLLDHSDAVHCTPYAINNHGAIVGSCTWPVGSTKWGAVYWSRYDAPVEVLPTIANPLRMLGGTSARDINDAGVIVGHAPRSFIHPGTNLTTWATAAARWASHTATPTTFAWSSPWIGPSGTLWGISASGRMSGQSSITVRASTGVLVDVPHATVLAANNFVADLGADFVPPNNDGKSMALKVNDAGTAVGWTDVFITTDVIRHRALRWPNGGTRTTIPGVPAVTLAASEAADVNEAGWITGAWGTGTNIPANAFIWKGNTAVPAMVLPRSSTVIAARGNAVSQVFDGPNGEKHAYVGGFLSLNASGTNARAVRWLVKQTAAEQPIQPLP
jgi:uncharacterized membrane protein